MQPSEIFRHCPRCGVRRATTTNPLRCAACGFLYYFNPCAAVAGFILNGQGEVLLLRRAKDPARGQLALPGGFINIGETAEAALRRETCEEVDLELGELSYLCSQLNSYLFEEIAYPVLDFFFVATARNSGNARPLDEVDALQWTLPGQVELDTLAFPSIREAWRVFAAQSTR